MNEHPEVLRAMRIATEAHAGQLDKSGRPYLGHLERTATKVRFSGGTWVQEAAAWLHDVVEDTEVDFDQLYRYGVPRSVHDIVSVMTHRLQITNEEYWAIIRTVPDAVLVKLCDIYDNLDPERMCYLDPVTQDRLRNKYARAIQVLCAS